MAFDISIVKFGKEDGLVLYRFESNGVEGVFSIDVANGDIALVERMPGDDGRIFNRAAVKVLRAWNEGVLPDEAEWAS